MASTSILFKLGLRRLPSGIARLLLGYERYKKLHLRVLQLQTNRRAFTAIYKCNSWGANETVSGAGSTLASSAALRKVLPRLLTELDARTLLDAGCGDFNWMKNVNLDRINYIGVDVVEPLIRRNIELYGSDNRSFLAADITVDRLPSADIALCRHCLMHLPNRQIGQVLRNLKSIGADYLLATNFPEVTTNIDIWPGSFRRVNLELAPFNLPRAIGLFNDSDRSSVLALWRFADILN
jgi:hypothetical protein